MAAKSIFLLIEKEMGERLPQPIAFILNETGFSTKIALKGINPDSTITQIEKFINKNYERLSRGLIGSIYENIQPFEIAPGHRVVIESIPQYMERIKTVKQISEFDTVANDFSFVLKMLIETAENNSGREPTGRRYNETIQHFATYIYLMCGRACYETLCTNLPLPQANTICKKTECYLNWT